MLISGIKSRPTYAPIVFDPTGLTHLLIGAGAGREVLERVVAEAPAAARNSITILYLPEGHAPASSSGVLTITVGDLDQLLKKADELLGQARMGLRLYIAGPEIFIWDVMKIADYYGMHKNEVAREIAGSLARRVFCTHCRNYDEGVTASIHPCSKCGEPLLVRDHFSRRHAAFMGVKVDAEAPGEVPAAEEAFP
jgi:predicted RNA-binding Zn-ribbon protein involved in translation (DUF1610 family)